MAMTKFGKWSVLALIPVIAAGATLGDLAWRQHGAEQYEDFEAILAKRYGKLGPDLEVVQHPDRTGPYTVINIHRTLWHADLVRWLA